jgi:Flp pilus assembly pilin Flp
LNKFILDEQGLELSEYGVAAALITVAILVALTTLGNIVTNQINALSNQITP